MFGISYETIATISQVTSLLMFVAMALAVVVYAFWPGNKQRFDAHQRAALDLETDQRLNGGRS